MGKEARANRARREAIAKIASRITGQAVDQGRIIELGFASLIMAAYPDWETMPLAQLEALRMAFFGGAQHIWGSIMNMLDPGSEATDRDLRRMELINHELEGFIHEFKHRHGIEDPDIGPESKTPQ